nr:tol-pal system protein YbgF [Nitrosomonas sp.]
DQSGHWTRADAIQTGLSAQAWQGLDQALDGEDFPGITSVLVAPRAKLLAVAEREGLDVSQCEIIDAPHGTRITTHPQPVENPAATQASAPPDNAAAETVIAAIPGQSLQPAGATEKQFYDAAYRQFVNGDYAGARSQFQAFLEHHPQSNLAPSAAYWIGNAHYALRDYQQAIAAQRNLITRYPDSAKVPDAMLNIASSQTELADRKAAKQTLEELIARYPFSGAAEKAKQRLSRLN